MPINNRESGINKCQDWLIEKGRSRLGQRKRVIRCLRELKGWLRKISRQLGVPKKLLNLSSRIRTVHGESASTAMLNTRHLIHHKAIRIGLILKIFSFRLIKGELDSKLPLLQGLLSKRFKIKVSLKGGEENSRF